jgi:hypothetical protein
MRAFIYVGGEIYPDNITEHPKGDDLCIAADSGYYNAEKLGEKQAQSLWRSYKNYFHINSKM